ncbi:MAG: DUF421 domain-containing protein [Clostridia bacterium]|nr:DUF421 domain-containing protein [Clostridia bacterium]
MELIFIRTILLFTISFIMIRLMGKRQLGELEPFEVVITVMVAEVAMTPIDNTSIPIVYGIIPIVTLFILHTFISYVSLKLNWFRKLVCGEENIIINDGCLLIDNMRKNDYSLDELNEQLREKGIFNIEEVSFAIIEASGTLSVLKKPPYQTPTKRDFDIPYSSSGLPIEIVACGKFKKDCSFNKKQFISIAKKHGFENVEHIFYASLSSENNLFIQDYNHKKAIVKLGEENV